MKATDFRRVALSLEGAEEGSHMGAADFRVGGRIFATLASLRQLDAHTGAAGAICRGVAGSVPAHSWRMGTDGEDPHSAGKSERGRADRRSAHRLEASSGKEYGDEKEERPAARLNARGIAPIVVAVPNLSRSALLYNFPE